MNKISIRKSRGFTLIELLVVVAIIGILASVVLASLNSARTKGKGAAIKSNLKNMIGQAELAYDIPGNYSAACASVAPMLSAINSAGATSSCFSFNSSGFADIYLRWGASGTIYSSTAPVKAWSSSPRGAVTWDAQGVNSSGAFVGTDVTMTWDAANTACTISGGRLPAMEELKTLADATYAGSGSTTYTPAGFVASSYWSSTTVPSDSTAVYYVGMSTGGIATILKTGTLYVRCVR